MTDINEQTVGQFADDHPEYYDISSNEQLRRVNVWLRGISSRPVLDLNSLYQEIRVKLNLIGLVLPDYKLTPEDAGEEIAFEVEWYPGKTLDASGQGPVDTDMGSEKIPGGLFLILQSNGESINLELVAGADYFEMDDLEEEEEKKQDDEEGEEEGEEEEEKETVEESTHNDRVDMIEQMLNRRSLRLNEENLKDKLGKNGASKFLADWLAPQSIKTPMGEFKFNDAIGKDGSQYYIVVKEMFKTVTYFIELEFTKDAVSFVLKKGDKPVSGSKDTIKLNLNQPLENVKKQVQDFVEKNARSIR